MSLREIGVPGEERSKTTAIRHLATSQSGARALPCFRPATSTSDCKLHPSELPEPPSWTVPSRRSYGIAVIFAELKPDPSPHPLDIGCLSWCIKVPRPDPAISSRGEGILNPCPG
ncbi:hypothetical protein ALC53_02208 [Atta colombica]|uniref:Uncharacterized protein n=1 Tax=Atta colombica TaxID=520822 RepID=A0A195BTY9_9HYME|nr:hypothetical protein ALC53_02208 [Atta colombica]